MNKRLLLSFCLVFSIGLAAQTVDVNLVRTYNGEFNNLDNPLYGAAHTPLLRLSGQGYADGMAEPITEGMPNPRVISNALFDQEDILSDPVGLSDYTWVFGQFMDHDLSLSELPGEAFNIPVPAGDPDMDPLFFGTVQILVTRNGPIPGTGTSPGNPRQYDNEITAFIDGSNVYGSGLAAANWLRSFEDGKLKVSAGNMLPYNTVSGELDSPEDPAAPHMANGTNAPGPLFVAGDPRANENPLLAIMHLLFVREHNRQCDLLKAEHPTWTDEQLYQHARKIVGGIIQAITYNEWLPTMGVPVPEYTGYNAEINPQIANVFSAAAFRVGHTLLNSNILRIGAAGDVIPQGNLLLRDGFFDTEAYNGIGIEPYLRGMAEQTQQQRDSKVVDDVRNFLFGPPGAGGADLPAINIARGRDRGLNSFNNIRQSYGLPILFDFSQINPDPDVYQVLETLYDNDINKIDPWPAMMAERSMDGSIFGPTVQRIMSDQFTKLRDGDRFFYLNDPVLSEAEKNMISSMTMRDIIMYNSNVDLMQDNVFRSMPFSDICGSATVNLDGWISVHSSNERLEDVTVDVLSSDGFITTSAQTTNLGFFAFDGLPACDPTTVRPSRSDDWIAGIDIIDIVAIRRDLLGIERFNNPYQYLAGDANEDGSMDVQDIVSLTRLLLDLDQELVADTDIPWRFVAGGYDFENPDWPFLDTDIPDVISFANTDPTDINQGFIAYKLGDVNADASVSPNLQPGLDVSVARGRAAAGETTNVTLTLSGSDVAGFDLELEAVNGSINRVVSTDLPGETYVLDHAGFHVVALEEGSAIHTVTLEVTMNTAGELADFFRLSNQHRSLSVDTNGRPRSITLGAAAGAGQTITGNVYPNPFTRNFTVSLSGTLERPAVAAVLDVFGRRVHTQAVASGVSTIEVAGLNLPQGTYLFQLIDDAGQTILQRKLTR